MSIGQSIITVDGINALSEASVHGGTVTPKYFKFSDQDLILNPNLHANDIAAWYTADISGYNKIDANSVEFVCDVAPENAIKYGRLCGLYLEDGTLFMVAKPPFAFPPQLRQTFKIQMQYQDLGGLTDFKYIPTDAIDKYVIPSWIGRLDLQRAALQQELASQDSLLQIEDKFAQLESQMLQQDVAHKALIALVSKDRENELARLYALAVSNQKAIIDSQISSIN